MKKKIFIIFLIISIISFLSFWQIASKGYDKQNKIILLIKKVIPSDIARSIRDNVFFIPKLQDRNKFLELQLNKYEQKLNGNLFLEKKVNSKRHNYHLKKFFLPFPSLDLSLGWRSNLVFKRAHYLEIINDFVFVISGEGETLYFKKDNIKNEKLNQNYIANNLLKTLNEKKSKLGAIRDLYYDEDYIYISVVELINTESTINIYRAKQNLEFLNFRIFFESNENFASSSMLQSGGRIEKFSNDQILLSVGYGGDYTKAQDENSILGKIISINKKTGEHKLISFGHRNPQGLFFLKENNLIINSEHGPQGGDEINFNFLNKKGKKNYGWPISSYGIPYPKQDKKFYKNNGYLKKSHLKHGFIEPFKYFTPSIGISEIIFNNQFLYISSLRAESIYIIETNDLKKIENQARIKFDSRIRDLKYDKEEDVFFLLFENIPAIGVLKFN
jgi:hypothetical protein